MFYFVRSDRVGAPAFVEELQRAVWAVNPELPLGSVEPLGALYERSMARTSLTLVLLAITAGMALRSGSSVSTQSSPTCSLSARARSAFAWRSARSAAG